MKLTELREMGLTWGEAGKLSKDRDRCQRIVAAYFRWSYNTERKDFGVLLGIWLCYADRANQDEAGLLTIP